MVRVGLLTLCSLLVWCAPALASVDAATTMALYDTSKSLKAEYVEGEQYTAAVIQRVRESEPRLRVRQVDGERYERHTVGVRLIHDQMVALYRRDSQGRNRCMVINEYRGRARSWERDGRQDPLLRAVCATSYGVRDLVDPALVLRLGQAVPLLSGPVFIYTESSTDEHTAARLAQIDRLYPRLGLYRARNNFYPAQGIAVRLVSRRRTVLRAVDVRGRYVCWVVDTSERSFGEWRSFDRGGRRAVAKAC